MLHICLAVSSPQILRVLANIAHKNKEMCVQLAQLGLLPTLCATLKMADQEMVTLSLEVLFMLVVNRPQVGKVMTLHSGDNRTSFFFKNCIRHTFCQ